MKIYNIKDYIKILKEHNLIVEIYNENDVNDANIENISYNSNKIKNNTLFICKGNNFKVEYLNDAITKGCICYVSEIKYNNDTMAIIVNDILKAMSVICNLYFSNPSSSLNVIGITGTKGKTTTAYYIKSILDEYAKVNNQKDTAIISSIDTYDGVSTYTSSLTTPLPLELENVFFNSVSSKVKNVVMEVSSQALKYHRVYSTNFNIGIFLNISEDHISNVEHKDFDDYFNSKLKIFEKSNIGIVNLDSNFSDKIYKKAKENCSMVYTYSLKNKTADVYAYDIKKDHLYTIFKVHTKNFDKEIILSMPGLFNVENAICAILVADIMNIPYECIYNGLKVAKASGRMEVYSTSDRKVVTIIDYAHNKLSFSKVFETAQKEYKNRKIICVFGSVGSKAVQRRKDLGNIAGRNSDYIFLTADDPGYEKVLDICDEIAKYVKNYTDNYEIIEDREEAVKKAFKMAFDMNDDSIILLLGKGREKTQKAGNKIVEYKSDVEIAKEMIQKYNKVRA